VLTFVAKMLPQCQLHESNQSGNSTEHHQHCSRLATRASVAPRCTGENRFNHLLRSIVWERARPRCEGNVAPSGYAVGIAGIRLQGIVILSQ
jgi:hypothetical protein